MENNFSKLSSRTQIILVKNLLCNPGFWNWFRINAANIGGEPYSTSSYKMPDELVAEWRKGSFAGLTPSLSTNRLVTNFLGLHVKTPLFFSGGSIAMNCINNTYINFAGGDFKNCDVQYVNGKMTLVKVHESYNNDVDDKGKDKDPKEDDVQSVIPVSNVSIQTGKVVGVFTTSVEDEDVQHLKDMTVGLAVMDKQNVKKAGVNIEVAGSTINTTGIYPPGYGAIGANKCKEMLGTQPRNTLMLVESLPVVKEKYAQLTNGYHYTLMQNSSSTYVSNGKFKHARLKENNISIQTAYNHRNASRADYGEDEKGIRALSASGPYCGLIDKHIAYKEHDLLLAIQDWIDKVDKGDRDGEEVGNLIKYRTGVKYYKVTGLPDNIIKRVITNVICPTGVGLFIETPKFVYASTDLKILCSNMPFTCVRELKIKPVNEPDFKDVNWPEKLKQVYQEEIKHYDFLGCLVDIKGGIIPLRSIHRGIVIHTMYGQSVYQDFVQAMVAANVYRNVWLLLLDDNYLTFMKHRLGEHNQYITGFKSIIIFNAPYVDSTKYDIMNVEGEYHQANRVDPDNDVSFDEFSPPVAQPKAINQPVANPNLAAMWQEFLRASGLPPSTPPPVVQPQQYYNYNQPVYGQQYYSQPMHNYSNTQPSNYQQPYYQAPAYQPQPGSISSRPPDPQQSQQTSVSSGQDLAPDNISSMF